MTIVFFREGVKQCLLEKMPNVLIEEFPDNEQAFYYVNECFNNKKKIDLIITDFNHPGNGFVFAKTVRELQRSFPIKIPIMLITMYPEETFTNAISDGIFDIYYPKSIAPEYIISFVKDHTSQVN